MILYIKDGCAHSARVLNAVDTFGVSLEVKNVADSGVAQELLERGGKSQEPFLYDEAKGTGLYESADIIALLTREYGTKRA